MSIKKILLISLTTVILGLVFFFLFIQWQDNKRVDDKIIEISKTYNDSNPVIVRKTQNLTDGVNHEPMYTVEIDGKFTNQQKTATHISFSIRVRDGYVWSLRAYTSILEWESNN